MTPTREDDLRIFFRGTRAKIDALAAALWLALEILRLFHRRRLRVPTRRAA